MNKKLQKIPVGRYAKLRDALDPKRGCVRIPLEGPPIVENTFAICKYIESTGGAVIAVELEPGGDVVEQHRTLSTGSSPVEPEALASGKDVTSKPA